MSLMPIIITARETLTPGGSIAAHHQPRRGIVDELPYVEWRRLPADVDVLELLIVEAANVLALAPLMRHADMNIQVVYISKSG